MAKKVTILSLGAGIQSTALALLLDQDMLPGYAKPDAAVFADTKAEPEWVYKTVKDLSEILSYPVITTSYSDLEADTWATLRREGTRKRPAQTSESIFFDIPTYVGLDTTPHPTTRRCTETYKIAPIRKAVREAFGWPLKVDQYLGISVDEIVRVKPSRVKYITNIHPLVDQRWTRNDCQLYLTNHWSQISAGRSACLLLPVPFDPSLAEDSRRGTGNVRTSLPAGRRPETAQSSPTPVLQGRTQGTRPGRLPPVQDDHPDPRRRMLRSLLHLNPASNTPAPELRHR